MNDEVIQDIKDKVDRMYIALIGNDISQDGGLVGRVVKLEEGQKEIKDEIQEIKDEHKEYQFAQKSLYAVTGFTIALLIKIIFGV